MRGAGLVLLVLLSAGIVHYSRWVLSDREELPAVRRLQPHLAAVVVVDSSGNYGLYQFSDGSKFSDVIKLTAEVPEVRALQESWHKQPFRSGEIVKVMNLEGKYFSIERSWLSARHRILLDIPLHPDRMTLTDWETLPGIGPKLAALIEADRQKNGDFGSFSALDRVKGIGIKKLAAWQIYFNDGSSENSYVKTAD